LVKGEGQLRIFIMKFPGNSGPVGIIFAVIIQYACRG
jgi:hypothetical protein